MKAAERQLHEDIMDYQNTIFAIIGFANCYRYNYENDTEIQGVKLFQGRKLRIKITDNNGNSTERTVTPDLGIVLPDDTGVIAEVKSRFPKDCERWADTFNQLMKYDDVLFCWPTATGVVGMHDIVLLLPILRSTDVRDYYHLHKEQFRFIRPFAMVEFEHSADNTILLRLHEGTLSYDVANKTLRSGRKIHLERLEKIYTVKILDSEPPLPYMMSLIWTQIVARRAADDPKYIRCSVKNPVHVTINVEDIVNELHEGFTLNSTFSGDCNHQPKLPHKGWVIQACKMLIQHRMAEWADEKKQKITIFYHRKLSDVYSHFISLCCRQPIPSGTVDGEHKQLSLFVVPLVEATEVEIVREDDAYPSEELPSVSQQPVQT